MTMPVLFIGHGSPMNMLEQNTWTTMWRQVADNLPVPKGIVVISAHWFGQGVRYQSDLQPDMLYDMYGFPEALYAYRYPAGNPLWLQERIKSRLPEAMPQAQRGYDHGAYSVLAHMFPKAAIPVCQVSIDAFGPPAAHMQLGKRLGLLRDEGILILASGNIVHNLRAARVNAQPAAEAVAFDALIADTLEQRDDDALINYQNLSGADYAVPHPDHFYPLLTAYGASRVTDTTHVFNRAITMGSISMTSYLFGDI